MAPQVGLELALVPAGWFWMGENDGRASNQPAHRVYLSAFEICTTEVTREQFNRFIEETGMQVEGWDRTRTEETGDLPVTGILWEDADMFCHWLGMRLPTEAEWEKAARGDDRRLYPWGAEWGTQKANTAEGGVGDVIGVGSLFEGASPYGLFDMSGNAAEWVADFYDPDYYSFSPERNPTGPELVVDLVLRGGSFDSPAAEAMTYFRDSSHSVQPNPRAGFRCARSVSETLP
jgi:iron(II)-dependent oxidoreductase